MTMGSNDNGFGGNIVDGASSDIEGVLKSVQGSLSRIDSLLKDIGNSFSGLKKSISGGGPAAAPGGTGQGTPAMPTPGAEGSGFGALGMMGGMAASWATDKALSGVMSLYKDAMPSMGNALTTQQLNYNFGVYSGQGRNALIMPKESNQLGFAQRVAQSNRFATVSETGWAALATGMSKSGAIGSNLAPGGGAERLVGAYGSLYQFAGVAPEQASQLASQSMSPQSEIAMMALGYKSPINSRGGVRNPFNIVADVMDATNSGGWTSNGLGVKKEKALQIFKQEARQGGALYQNYEATGQPMEFMEYAPYYQQARQKYEDSGNTDWSSLSRKKQFSLTKELTDIENVEVNPQAGASDNMFVRAMQSMGLSQDVFTGWQAANERINQYLGYLSNLPLLGVIAQAYGYNANASQTEAGTGGVLFFPWLAEHLPDWALPDYLTGSAGGGEPIPSLEGHPMKGWDSGGTKGGGGGESKIPTGNALGDWNVGKDMISKIHQGEMILPSRIAEAVRTDLASGGRPPQNTPDDVIPTRGELALGGVGGSTGGGGGGSQVTINVSVAQASQEEAVRFAEMVKGILQQETYLSAVGKGHGY